MGHESDRMWHRPNGDVVRGSMTGTNQALPMGQESDRMWHRPNGDVVRGSMTGTNQALPME